MDYLYKCWNSIKLAISIDLKLLNTPKVDRSEVNPAGREDPGIPAESSFDAYKVKGKPLSKNSFNLLYPYLKRNFSFYFYIMNISFRFTLKAKWRC